jgi:hypothetical protein
MQQQPTVSQGNNSANPGGGSCRFDKRVTASSVSGECPFAFSLTQDPETSPQALGAQSAQRILGVAPLFAIAVTRWTSVIFLPGIPGH